MNRFLLFAVSAFLLAVSSCKTASLVPELLSPPLVVNYEPTDTVVEVFERIDSFMVEVPVEMEVDCPPSDTGVTMKVIYQDRVKTKTVYKDSIYTIKVFEKIVDPGLTAALAGQKALEIIASGKHGLAWHWTISLLILLAFLLAWNLKLRNQISWQKKS